MEHIMDDYASTVANSVLRDEQKFAITMDKLNELVNAYFDLSEREVMLVEDTVNVIEPSSTPSSKASSIETLRVPIPVERVQYADTLCATLNEWAKRGPWRVSATITTAENQGMALVTLSRSRTAAPTAESTVPPRATSFATLR